MKRRIEYQILGYLGFQPSNTATALWRTSEEILGRGLAFTDTAGLTLHLLAKLKKQADLAKLPVILQQRLERNFRDNCKRTDAARQEFIQFNQLLQAQGIRYLNLKGLVLYPDFDLIPIRSLDNVWQDSTLVRFPSLSIPVLSRKHTLLYCVLHAFRHLLRNDLRLSHLYELAFFLEHHHSNEDFWKKFFASIAHCPRSQQAVATMFQLPTRVSL